MITLHHIVTENGYNFLMDKGYLIGDGRRIIRPFKDAYDWLVDEMDKKLKRPFHTGKYPVWAWYQWDGKNGVDLRKYRHICERGLTYYLIRFEIDENDVVLSDFDRWHCVLNNCYLAESDNEYDEFVNTYDKDAIYEMRKCVNKDGHVVYQKIKQTWHRIFDVTKPWYGVGTNSIDIQATFWRLEKDMILNVKKFQGNFCYKKQL